MKVNPSTSSEDNLSENLKNEEEEFEIPAFFYVNKNFKTEGKMKDFSSPKNLSHFPVMLEVLKICNPSKGGNFIDCTFGYGGYTKCNIIISQN